MNEAEFFLERIVLTRPERGETVYLSVYPEMVPSYPVGIKPSGNYIVYCVFPKYGSCFMIIEQDEDCQWVCKPKPSFISDNLISWIGLEWENRAR